MFLLLVILFRRQQHARPLLNKAASQADLFPPGKWESGRPIPLRCAVRCQFAQSTTHRGKVSPSLAVERTCAHNYIGTAGKNPVNLFPQ
jgi:hypothetical protein